LIGFHHAEKGTDGLIDGGVYHVMDRGDRETNAHLAVEALATMGPSRNIDRIMETLSGKASKKQCRLSWL
jgi:hypothetical protein